MKPDCKKITQVINYLTRRCGDGDAVPELKIIKLIWAADRYHLRKYARTVTYDNYVAMFRGPVGSTTKDVVEFETGFGNVSDGDNRYSEKFLKFYQTNGDGYITAVAETDMNELSETDVEALDFAIENFGKMSTDEVINFTHKYPEWEKHEQTLFKEKKVEKISLLDFFQNPIGVYDDPFAIPNDVLEASKEIYSEYT